MTLDPAEIHVPVMLDRCTELLLPSLQADGPGEHLLIDGTLGMGGHSAALLTADPAVRVLGIDRDPAALQLAEQRLAFAGGRFEPVRAVFDELGEVLRERGIAAVAGVLLDLGVSSLQLDSDERGFAYSRDTPLDMRMDGHGPVTAADVVNQYSAKELTRVFREFGEERFAQRIAAAIVTSRQQRPLATTGELSALVAQSIPAAARRTGRNPAKRVFQALRIEVNDELGALRRVLPAALDALAPGGRIVVLSYHSLEDRIVKRAFAAATTAAGPVDMPVPPPPTPFRLLTRGAEQASDAEVSENPRATSVRLRAVERRVA